MLSPVVGGRQQQRHHRQSQRLQQHRHVENGSVFFRTGKWFAICCVIGIVVVMICLGVMEVLLPSPSSMSRLEFTSNSNSKKDDHHTIPTVLSVMDPTTGLYLRAPGLENPLYSYLLSSTSMHGKNEEEYDGEDESSFTSTVLSERRGLRRVRPTKMGEVQLKLDKTALYNFGDSLTVSWEKQPQETQEEASDKDENDILAMYCPSRQSPLADSTRLKVQHLVDAATVRQVRYTSEQHSRYGPGWAPRLENSFPKKNEWYIPSFPILRHDSCEFCYFQQVHPEDQQHTLAGCTSLELPHAERKPTAIHLALTDDPTEMLVQFTTGDRVGTPVAMYGPVLDPNAGDPSTFLVNKVEGDDSSSGTYDADDMCQDPATNRDVGNFIPPGTLHHLLLPELDAGSLYVYKVGLASGQGILWSDVYAFTSAPALGSEPQDEPLVLIAFGDQGCPEGGWAMGGQLTTNMVENEINSGGATLVTHFGDLSYAMGAGHTWDEWLAMIQPYAARVPLMVGVGNHEYDHTAGGSNGKDPSGVSSEDGFHPSWGNFGADSGGECGVPVARRFTMPDTGNGVFWYSYNYGNVHLIMISSEHDLSPFSVQYQWLQKDLTEGVNRTVTPWVILQTHRPMYNGESLWEQNAVGMGMRFEFEDLLLEAKVDLVLAGHYHSYHRSCAGLYQSVCYQGGPTHITVGTAGAPLDTGDLYDVEWTEFFSNHEWGYGRLKVYNNSAMEWNYVSSHNGTVLDTFWFLK